jgi:hypothetical protein
VEIVNASICWDGPSRDILMVFVEPTPDPWGATSDDVGDDVLDLIVVFRALDENEEATGEVAGLEILDFLIFDRWDAIPRFPMLWQLPGREPLPLDELLKRVQRELREQAKRAADRTTTPPVPSPPGRGLG